MAYDSSWLLKQRLSGWNPDHVIVITKPGIDLDFLPDRYLHIVLDSDNGVAATHGLSVVVAYPVAHKAWARRTSKNIIKAAPKELLSWQLDSGIWHVMVEDNKRSLYTTGVPPLDLINHVTKIKEKAQQCYETSVIQTSTSNLSTKTTQQDTSQHQAHTQTAY